MVQVVEHLPDKSEALSSNPTTASTLENLLLTFNTLNETLNKVGFVEVRQHGVFAQQQEWRK
jgi:hypothetical protein